MVITPMLQKGVTVDLAKVNNPTQMPDADKEDALIVAVMRNGDVFFGNDRIAPVMAPFDAVERNAAIGVGAPS